MWPAAAASRARCATLASAWNSVALAAVFTKQTAARRIPGGGSSTAAPKPSWPNNAAVGPCVDDWPARRRRAKAHSSAFNGAEVCRGGFVSLSTLTRALWAAASDVAAPVDKGEAAAFRPREGRRPREAFRAVCLPL